MRKNFCRRQNVYKNYLPHNWLGFKGLSVVWRVFFYATLVFGVYAAYNWIQVLRLPDEFWQYNSAPLKQIYGYAAGASLLVCMAELGILRVLAVLEKIRAGVEK